MVKALDMTCKSWAIIMGSISLVLLLIIIWLLYSANNIDNAISENEIIIISEEEVY
jgi:hypothetical protein